MSRKIEVDIGDANERYCMNCPNQYSGREAYCRQFGATARKRERTDISWLRCPACIKAEIKPVDCDICVHQSDLDKCGWCASCKHNPALEDFYETK